MRAEQLTDPITFHGEGAVWSEAWGGLKIVDMLAGDVLSIAPDGSVERMATGSSIAALVRPRHDGGFVVATEREFQLRTADGETEWVSDLIVPDGSRFNEGSCDPRGRLLCGTLAYDHTPGAGTMYRLDNRATETVFTDLTISNGLGFTADGSRAYYVDSPTRRIDVFDVDAAGDLSNRRPWVHLPEGKYVPDGLWVDEADGVWVALYNGGAVHHYDATGTLADVVDVPVSKVTSCTLGGADRTTLFITTSREGLPDDAEPAAGSVYTAQVGVHGVPVLTFAG